MAEVQGQSGEKGGRERAASPSYAVHQHEIYLRGIAGQRPDRPVDWRELERRAAAALAEGPWGYIAGGAGLERTMAANRAAFDRWRLVPRMLRDVSQRWLSRTVVGTPLPVPVLLAPVGVQTLAHPDGELASARAAAAVGIPMIASTASSFPLEQVADAGKGGGRWFQLYWPSSRELAESFVARAEAAGYGALVVTLDTGLLSWRPVDLDHAFLPFLWAEGIANFVTDPVFRSGLARPPEEDRQGAVLAFVSTFANPGLTWADLAWLREATRLPIVLKGILHPDDARRAVDAGAAGVVVSNHGGRQVDGAVASLDALPGVVEAVGDTCEVLLDSGVRCGADVVKALALGARAVLLGRPYLWGLALGGQAGVQEVLRALLADVDLTMALSGHADVDDLTPEALVRAPGGGA